jgi:hypothetical protein
LLPLAAGVWWLLVAALLAAVGCLCFSAALWVTAPLFLCSFTVNNVLMLTDMARLLFWVTLSLTAGCWWHNVISFSVPPLAAELTARLTTIGCVGCWLTCCSCSLFWWRVLSPLSQLFQWLR